MSNPAYPEIARKRPPEPQQCAIELYGLPDDWTFIHLDVKSLNEPTEYTIMEGAVYPKTLFGEPDYSNPKPGTKFKLSLPTIIWEKWKLDWERETGFCFKCKGSGRYLAKWGKEIGPVYRDCTRCGATGKSSHIEAAA